MIVHARQVSTSIMDIPETLDFHIALTYSAQSEQALRRIFGTLPNGADMLVMAFDVFREIDIAGPSDFLRQAIQTAAVILAGSEIEFILGEWQCLLTGILFLRDGTERLPSILRSISEAIEENSIAPVHGASSNLVSDFRRLPDAALEALEAIRFGRYVTSAPNVILLSDWDATGSRLQGTLAQRGEPDFEELIDQLIHTIHNESAEAVQEISDQCVSTLIGGLPRSSALYFMFITFCGQLERALHQFHTVESGYLAEHHLFPQLLHTESESDLRHAIGTYLQEIWVCYNQKKYSMFADSMQGAMAYIDDNLTDPLLSISTVAEALSMTPSRLTAQFKRFYGDSIPNTIHKKRIAKIRSALLETNAPIREIASKYGYVSIATFNRTFYKYEGMYPRAFRAQNAPI